MFKVGDIITGTSRMYYSITSRDAIMRVRRIGDFYDVPKMDVVILEHRIPGEKGCSYTVNNDDRRFRLLARLEGDRE